MRRRDFLTALGSTAFLTKANAQQPRPVIGFLHQGALPPPLLKAAFRKGLIEVGISDGSDILIEDRAADGKYDQLPSLAADLVNRQVAVIAAELLPAALAAKAATQLIPIVFVSGSDPIGSGLVSSINRPTSNVTGIAFMFTRLGAKNLDLLHELVPQATVIGALRTRSILTLSLSSKTCRWQQEPLVCNLSLLAPAMTQSLTVFFRHFLSSRSER